MQEFYDPREIKSRLSFLDLAQHEGLEVRRSGRNHVAVCPFHLEKSGSFTIYTERSHEDDHAHCFGCGWNGDIIKFWQEKRNVVDFPGAMAALARLANVAPSERRRAYTPTPARRVVAAPREKPQLPKLVALGDDQIQQLAELRGLSFAGVFEAAMKFRRVGMAQWPQYQDRWGIWRPSESASPCWVVTDESRNVAQFRRLDGGKFVRSGGKEIKAWTKGSPTWPIGAAEMGDRGAVLLVEGGADMLAAYHFLYVFRRLDSVAVVAMLGASCAICDEALPFFERKRVRLMLHLDAPDPKTGKVAAFEAGERWTRQLTGAGAACESFLLNDLVRRDGSPVGDLNDLALCDESLVMSPDVREAFFDFDF